MFPKKYASLRQFSRYFARQRRMLLLLFCCMITASSMGVLLSYLMSRQLIAITELSTRGMVTFTLFILATLSVHHITWFFWGKLSAIIGNRVARAILKNTEIILFDEPTSALDSENRARFMETICELKRTKTIFVITHDRSDMSAFDCILEMNGGRIISAK